MVVSFTVTNVFEQICFQICFPTFCKSCNEYLQTSSHIVWLELQNLILASATCPWTNIPVSQSDLRHRSRVYAKFCLAIRVKCIHTIVIHLSFPLGFRNNFQLWLVLGLGIRFGLHFWAEIMLHDQQHTCKNLELCKFCLLIDYELHYGMFVDF